MSIELTVSAVAGQVGLSPDAVRYYERLGLLPPPARSRAGYRLYDAATIERLRLIKGAQRVGLRLHQIGELLEVIDHGQCPCGHTQALLAKRLAEVDAELDRLGVLRATLARLLAKAPQATGAASTGSQWWCVQVFSDAANAEASPRERR
jgi:DNA-binding transcriptional MerR regulator